MRQVKLDIPMQPASTLGSKVAPILQLSERECAERELIVRGCYLRLADLDNPQGYQLAILQVPHISREGESYVGVHAICLSLLKQKLG